MQARGLFREWQLAKAIIVTAATCFSVSVSFYSQVLAQPVVDFDPDTIPWGQPELIQSLRNQELRYARLVQNCSPEKRAEVLQPITEPQRCPDDWGQCIVRLDCNLTLSPGDVVTKEIWFSGATASGVTLDCAGATISGTRYGGSGERNMIRVEPRMIDGVWTRPENVTIKNCRVEGSARIYGAYRGATVNQRDILISSRQDTGHTARMRNLAPRAIVFKNMDIVGAGRTVFYFGPGVTESALIDSRITGNPGGGPAVYLGAETGFNSIIGNTLRVDSRREQLAVDASSGNRIINNWIHATKGGVYLYRNCGEDGVVRHQTPERNIILHNNFSIQGITGIFASPVAIHVGSRQGSSRYCDLDSNAEFGSGASDLDFARWNVIAENWYTPVHSEFDPFIEMDDVQNLAFDNISRRLFEELPFSLTESSCYFAEGFPTPWLRHGESTMYVDRGLGPVCEGRRFTCDNGYMIPLRAACPSGSPIEVRRASCTAIGTNDGCSVETGCSPGEEIVSIKAACNLETVRLTPADLQNQAWGTLAPTVVSDHRSDGHCTLADISISDQQALLSVFRTGPISAGTRLRLGCREHDRNGGECKALSMVACRRH